MAEPARRPRTPEPGWRRARVWVAGVAAVAVAGLVATLAVAWPGYDAQQTPLDDGTVWALQTGAGSGYARVNLALGEIDTVKQVENGSTLAQTDRSLLVFSDGGARFAPVSMATPVDLTVDADDAFTAAPGGTVEVLSAGDMLAFRTDGGDVFGATISGGGSAVAIDPFADVEVEEGEDRPRFLVTAAAVDEAGVVYAYSAEAGRVLRARADTGRILGEDAAPADVTAAAITAVGGRWVLLDPAAGEAFLPGRTEPIETGTVGAVLQQSSVTGEAAYLADAEGLVRVDLGRATSERIAGAGAALGTPAAPAALDGAVYAAWLPESSGDEGTLWSRETGELTPLDYAGTDIGETLDPVFVGNGTRLALNERRSGWVWTVPEGRLVASSQQWNLDEQADQQQDENVDAERVLDPKPPVAVDDAFGVRAGATVPLAVLLNDHDPNEDVLTIDPASVEGLDPAFGTVQVTGAEQALSVRVADGATGSASLRYRVTDGTAGDGLYSAPATVALTVIPEAENSAPVWCGTSGCLARWPTPQVVPGGTVSVDVLSGWVDPEGDPVYLAGAAITAGTGTVAASPGGILTYQHPDPNSSDATGVQILLTISDGRGATVEQPLSIQVTPTPALSAQSFAVNGVVGEQLSIPLLPHVSGATGKLAVTNAVTLDEGRSTVAINVAASSLMFSATQAGSFPVQYTVRDDLGERTATVRVTVRDGGAAIVSTPPLTAFVRPGEDATVDVLPAVNNPAGLVLLVGDVRPQSDPDAALTVDLVGQHMLRVSGATDSGRSGRLGVVRYTISDGTDNPTARAEGELTVVLLPAPGAEPPIAVDDRVTVRAGAQIDIPVLDNDTAPAGAMIGIDPSRIVNETDAGLAFAAGDVLRYLAPGEPGVYTIGYTIFRMGYPEAVDSARVIVTVVGAESNQPPVPRLLTGRVLSGESVRIPLATVGIDPDGDAIVLDRILTQPESGSATISAEGDAIVYTSADGFAGQVRFQYQVRDSRRATGSAEVRVGVLNTQSNPSPITYSDYLQLHVGVGNEAILAPADNDIDPGGGELELVEVRPNAQQGTAEYEALAAMIGGVEDGRVTLRAGEDLGTYSFVYTVRNDTGDTAMGLIVVKVVREPVPDYPVVTDTVLTIETREAFPGGVDVLSGKVSWTGGDASGLTLALWGEHPGISVDGWRISGAIPAETLLIPFEVSGAAFDGTPVSSFGFLRVLGDNDIRLSLRAGTPPLAVKEKETVDLDLATVVPVPPGQTLQVGEGVRAGGSRANATCAIVAGTTVRYSAGTGAPWTDTCVVSVRLAGQAEDTSLTIRVEVEAEIPQPVLRSASLAVSPGSTQTYDLQQMVGWAGKEDWPSVQYQTSYAGDQFTVVQQGQTVTVTALDAARPGREEQVALTLPSHPDTRAASLVLTVGPAPSTLPKGGSVAQSCSQSGGNTSCTIPVIGTGGEVNPLPGTPLRLVGVSGPAGCTGVSFSVAGASAVLASWSGDAPGAAECTGSFVVEDAQGRQSSGDRNGQVILDLQGLPATPTRLEWTGYSESTVSLRVTSDTSSHPAVEGYRILSGGTVVTTCPASGVCPAIPATMEEPAAYEARAFSSVGESRASTSPVTAWAFKAPRAPTGSSFQPVPTGDGAGGVAEITITGIDPSTGELRISGGAEGDRTVSAGGQAQVTFTYRVGSNTPATLTATPVTRYPLPPVEGSGSQVGTALSVVAHGLGAPTLTLTATASTDGDPGSVTATLQAGANGTLSGSRVVAGAVIAGQCRATDDVAAGGGHEVVFDGLEPWETYTVTACAETLYNGQSFGSTSTRADARPTTGIPAPSGTTTYTVPGEYVQHGNVYEWTGRITGPSISPVRFFRVYYSADGGGLTEDFGSLFRVGSHPGSIQAVFCRGESCGPGTAITPTGAAYQARATFPTESCTTGQPTRPAASVSASPGDYEVSSAWDGDSLVYTLIWKNALAGLQDVSGDGAYVLTCTPPPPDPEPEPEEPEEPPAGP